uniref:Uncharacterized protein n=1 Tax=Clytia hemisphaerica TaxID=252671 RepID=A0A7M5V1F5_9CNID
MSMTVKLNEAHLRNAYPLFLHESAHVALVYVEKHPAWKEAQELDHVFISIYAKENPDREDVAESFVPWLKVKRDPDSEQSLTIKNAIPNRLKVFDDLVGKTYSNQF